MWSTVVWKTRCSQRGGGGAPSATVTPCRCLIRKVSRSPSDRALNLPASDQRPVSPLSHHTVHHRHRVWIQPGPRGGRQNLLQLEEHPVYPRARVTTRRRPPGPTRPSCLCLSVGDRASVSPASAAPERPPSTCAWWPLAVWKPTMRSACTSGTWQPPPWSSLRRGESCWTWRVKEGEG